MLAASSSLGIAYNFPETNPSSVVPNTTFTVDVPVDAIARDAIYAAYPTVMALLPSFADAAADHFAQNPYYAQKAADALVPHVTQAALSQLTAYPGGVQAMMRAALPGVLPYAVEAALVEAQAHPEQLQAVAKAAWPALAPQVEQQVKSQVTAVKADLVRGTLLLAAATGLGASAWWLYRHRGDRRTP